MTNPPRPVVLLYNCPVEAAGAAAAAWREADAGVLNEVEAVSAALRALGVPFAAAGVRRLSDLPSALAPHPGAVAFNLVERLDGDIGDFNYVPAVCAALGHPCTGNGTAALTLTFDKALTQARLRAFGVPTPDGRVWPPGAPAPRLPTPPWIVKPLCADGSEGIEAASVADSDAKLAAAVARVHDRFGQPALVEPYIAGREFNLSLFARAGRVEIMPLAEIDFSLFPAGRPHIVDYAVKWVPGTIPGHVSPRHFPGNVAPDLAERLRAAAAAAWSACDCAGYVRVDFRVDAGGQPYVLEVNANPDLSPKAGFPAALAAGGVAFADFIRLTLDNATAS